MRSNGRFGVSYLSSIRNVCTLSTHISAEYVGEQRQTVFACGNLEHLELVPSPDGQATKMYDIHALIPKMTGSPGRQARTVDVPIDPLTEVARGGLITRNPRALLAQDVGALEQFVLHIRAIVRQTTGGIQAGDVHILKGNVGTGALIRTVDRRSNVEPGRAMDVFPFHVFDLQCRGIAVLIGASRVHALGNLNGQSDIVHFEVAESNVFHEAGATATPVTVAGSEDARALPGLDIGAIHGVLDCHILKGRVEVVVGHVWVLTDRSDRDSGAAFAIDILGKEVCCIALGCDAIIAADDGGIFH